MHHRRTTVVTLIGIGIGIITGIAAAEPIVIGDRVTIHSKVLDEERTVFVSVPAGASDEARAPVLYLTDAETQFQHAVSTVRFLARNQLMPDLIVVGITNTDRTRDLTPTRADYVRADGRVTTFPSSGGADRFLDFIQNELAPHVEETYPALGYRMFAGHSFGGLLAVHACLTRPELFRAVIAASPSLAWDDRLMLRTARAVYAGDGAAPRSLFVTVGSEGPEMTAAFDEFTAFVAETHPEGLRFGSRIFPDEDHGSVVERSFERGLRFLFEGWRPPRDPATGWPAGTLDDLEAHFAALSERLGIKVAVPENAVNLVGYRLMGEERTEEALRAFERAAELYPDSANVWDSLGEGLEAAGRLAEARDSYAKAVELGTAAADANLHFFEEHLEKVEAALAGTPDQR